MKPADRAVIHRVHTLAFQPDDARTAPEAALVEQLITDGDAVAELSLVAEIDQQIVGHVLCSRGDIDGNAALGLGPIGVIPDHQRHGIGHALMHTVLGAADAMGAPCVLLLGDPGYYRRFGFELAAAIGVQPPDPTWVEHFQIRRLTTWSTALHGTFHYPPAFSRLWRIPRGQQRPTGECRAPAPRLATLDRA